MAPRLTAVAEKISTFVGICALLGFGFYTDSDVWSIEIGSLVFRVFEGFLSVSLFSVAVAGSGILLTYEVWRTRSASETVTTGPPVEAIIPAYQDAAVLDESVSSLLDSEYAPLQITIVVEPDDDPTRERAKTIAATHDSVEWLVNEIPGSKATAINSTVDRSTADYFVVFDADERASPAFVSTAMSELTGETDVFQGRRIPRPSGLVETLAYCERVIVQALHLVSELLGFTHCQSSATGFTRPAFEAVGGYEDMLTEDLYFSHQCYQAELVVTRNGRCTSTMEAPHTLRDFWGQRKRWRIGHVQVAHRRIREALEGPVGVTDLVTVGRSIGAVFAGGTLLILTAHAFFLFIVDFVSALVLLGSIFGMIVGVWTRDARDGRVGFPTWSILLAPLVYLGYGVLTVKALLEYSLVWDGEWYQVTKTGS